jgi:hypothetical protein
VSQALQEPGTRANIRAELTEADADRVVVRLRWDDRSDRRSRVRSYGIRDPNRYLLGFREPAED